MNRKSVAAAWANKTQENARIPSGNFYFTGPTLYSYGPHYVCAHHLPEVYNRAGRQIALINSADYSVTTTRHVHIARCALPDSVIRIEVPGLNADNVYDIRKHGCRDIVNLLLLRMGQLEAKAANPRIRSSTRAALLDEIDHARANAVHLAAIDATRADIGEDRRETARAQLVTLANSIVQEKKS